MDIRDLESNEEVTQTLDRVTAVITRVRYNSTESQEKMGAYLKGIIIGLELESKNKRTGGGKYYVG